MQVVQWLQLVLNAKIEIENKNLKKSEVEKKISDTSN